MSTGFESYANLTDRICPRFPVLMQLRQVLRHKGPYRNTRDVCISQFQARGGSTISTRHRRTIASGERRRSESFSISITLSRKDVQRAACVLSQVPPA